jgi:hypothetical protein
MDTAKLDAFVGTWEMSMAFPGHDEMTGGTLTYEWMDGDQFLVQRWDIPDVPEAPGGIAIIGDDPEGEGYLQHYFDTRGAARVYRMEVEGRVWRLRREQPDFSEFNFAQRGEGRFSEDGQTIDGHWKMKKPGESEYSLDFEWTYRKVS